MYHVMLLCIYTTRSPIFQSIFYFPVNQMFYFSNLKKKLTIKTQLKICFSDSLIKK